MDADVDHVDPPSHHVKYTKSKPQKMYAQPSLVHTSKERLPEIDTFREDPCAGRKAINSLPKDMQKEMNQIYVRFNSWKDRNTRRDEPYAYHPNNIMYFFEHLYVDIRAVFMILYLPANKSLKSCKYIYTYIIYHTYHHMISVIQSEYMTCIRNLKGPC